MILGSLLTGLLAWALGVVAIRAFRGRKILILLSVAACCASALLSELYIRHLAEIGDFAAILDTVPTITTCVAVMIVVTLLLNTLALLLKPRPRQKKKDVSE